jgi:intracellular proteinase inhibitor BsuPI
MRPRPFTRPLAALAAAVLAACPAPEPGPAPPPPMAAADGPLASSLQIEASRDSVRFVLQVTNTSAAPVMLGFNSGQTYDFVVLDAGRELWRWSADMGFTQALRSETLAPGETRAWSERWRPPAEARGRQLTGVGRLVARDHPVERTSPFVVP